MVLLFRVKEQRGFILIVFPNEPPSGCGEQSVRFEGESSTVPVTCDGWSMVRGAGGRKVSVALPAGSIFPSSGSADKVISHGGGGGSVRR